MDVINQVRAGVLGHFGVETADSASVTFLGLEPIDILRVPDGDLVHYVTLGGSRHPMADPTAALADPVRGPRAELVLSMRGNVGAGSGLTRTLAVLVASPSVEGIVLQPDALLDFGEPLWGNANFTAVLLDESDIPEVTLPEPADPVRFMNATPITATEAAWVRIRGAAALREAWTEAKIDVRDPNRGSASL